MKPIYGVRYCIGSTGDECGEREEWFASREMREECYTRMMNDPEMKSCVMMERPSSRQAPARKECTCGRANRHTAMETPEEFDMEFLKGKTKIIVRKDLETEWFEFRRNKTQGAWAWNHFFPDDCPECDGVNHADCDYDRCINGKVIMCGGIGEKRVPNRSVLAVINNNEYNEEDYPLSYGGGPTLHVEAQ